MNDPLALHIIVEIDPGHWVEYIAGILEHSKCLQIMRDVWNAGDAWLDAACVYTRQTP